MATALQNPSGVNVIHAVSSDAPWLDANEGTQIKILAIDEERHSVELLFKLAPGYRSGRHRHLCESHAFVLEGEVHNLTLDRVYKAGDYYYQPPGDEHEEFFPTGAVAYASFRSDGDTLVELFGDDGEVCGVFKVSDFLEMLNQA